ncbi:hypothetical protein [Aeoliella mucimassa]|uniref:Transmembrane protein n=1 Tax=Aeoliella mucimassa TaxID=2527972 RepID=A0A518ATK3_9BACT|nr:hypothetical protein [Aeoliella mucimassa]QDU58052.1 hypothetical protein Pan181_42780 [Aeoliella mucimassa]
MQAKLNPTNRFELQDTLHLLTKPLALAMRGRVMLLAVVGVLAIWAADRLLVDQSAGVVPLEATGVAGWWAACWGQLQGIWLGFVDPFVQLVRGEHLLASAVRCLVRVLVWGLVGGAIARLSVLHLTRHEEPNLVASLRYVWSHKSHFLGGPVVMLVGLAIVALPLGAAKLAMQVTWLAPVAAVLWPLVLVVAMVATVYAFGALLGWPIMVMAAAADQSDSFDAVSRVYAYVFQKPLRLVGYLAAMLVLGTSAAAVSQLLATTVVAVGEATAGETPSTWAAETTSWWMGLVGSVVTVYLTSLFWTTSAGLYLLRRRDVDCMPTDEVYIDPAEFRGTIPTLQPGETGVPEIVGNQADAA